MPKLNANLSMMFNEVDFTDRFDAAAKAGFKSVPIEVRLALLWVHKAKPRLREPQTDRFRCLTDTHPYNAAMTAAEPSRREMILDSAIALFTLALTAGATTREAAEVSNLASGVVVGKIGTATLTADELVAAASAG